GPGGPMRRLWMPGEISRGSAKGAAPGRPALWLAAVTFLTALCVERGGLQADTQARLQVTHSFWTAEPQFLPELPAAAGVPSRGGRMYAPYGPGQSLVMLPADVAATLATDPLHLAPATRRNLRGSLVAFTVFPLIGVAGVLFAFLLLKELGFSPAEA